MPTSENSLEIQMKIAVLADALDTQTAGIYVYLKELLDSIHRIDHRNQYIIIRPLSKNDYPNWEEITVPINPRIPFHQRIRQFIHIPSLLNQLKPDVVLEPGHFGPFNLDKSIKRVTVIHDLTPILFPEYHIKTSQLTHKWFLPRILRKADHIITNSENTTKDVIAYHPAAASKITSIHLGKHPAFRATDPSAVIKKYDLRPNYLLYLGTLEPRKNLDVLLSAFEKYKSTHPTSSTQLVLAGKQGWRIEPFLDKVAASKWRSDIKLLGYLSFEELPALYSGAAISVYPSHYEGFGFPVLEAMACGTAVICSDNSSLPEVGGAAVAYFETGDVEGLVEQMAILLGDKGKRMEMGKAGLLQAEGFDWGRTAERTVEVLERLA